MNYSINSFNVGDILFNQWGYDQTNVDFYQVVATTAKTVTVRQIAAVLTERSRNSASSMTAFVTTINDAFKADEKPMRKR
jgi:hypothetical protein